MVEETSYETEICVYQDGQCVYPDGTPAVSVLASMTMIMIMITMDAPCMKEKDTFSNFVFLLQRLQTVCSTRRLRQHCPHQLYGILQQRSRPGPSSVGGDPSLETHQQCVAYPYTPQSLVPMHQGSLSNTIHGHSKTGCPIVYEQPGQMQLKELFRSGCEIDDMIFHYQFLMEFFSNIICTQQEVQSLSSQNSSG